MAAWLVDTYIIGMLFNNVFLFSENVSYGGHRQSRSIPVAIKAPISKEHSLIRTRNTDNDHNAVIYVIGNVVTITTCSMIMIINMTLFLYLCYFCTETT